MEGSAQVGLLARPSPSQRGQAEERQPEGSRQAEKADRMWQFDFRRFATILINDLIDLCMCVLARA
jgi:hypothetical protein